MNDTCQRLIHINLGPDLSEGDIAGAFSSSMFRVLVLRMIGSKDGSVRWLGARDLIMLEIANPPRGKDNICRQFDLYSVSCVRVQWVVKRETGLL